MEKAINDDTRVWIWLPGWKVMPFTESLEEVWREDPESGFRCVEFGASEIPKGDT